MKTLVTGLILIASFSSHAAYFCGTVESIENNEVTYSLVDDDGKIHEDYKIKNVEDGKTIALAKLVQGDKQFKLCSFDHPKARLTDSPFITNVDRVVK
jgi:hypothetical protein